MMVEDHGGSSKLRCTVTYAKKNMASKRVCVGGGFDARDMRGAKVCRSFEVTTGVPLESHWVIVSGINAGWLKSNQFGENSRLAQPLSRCAVLLYPLGINITTSP